MAEYKPKGSRISCRCAKLILLKPENLVDPDTGDYQGAIWQHECACGRSYTLEVAYDPDYPGAVRKHSRAKVSTTCITCGRARTELQEAYASLSELVDKTLSREPLPPCKKCDAVPARCGLCDDKARYFLTVEAKNRSTDMHLCEEHAKPYAAIADELPDGIEMGTYCPNSDCGACDPWK